MNSNSSIQLNEYCQFNSEVNLFTLGSNGTTTTNSSSSSTNINSNINTTTGGGGINSNSMIMNSCVRLLQLINEQSGTDDDTAGNSNTTDTNTTTSGGGICISTSSTSTISSTNYKYKREKDNTDTDTDTDTDTESDDGIVICAKSKVEFVNPTMLFSTQSETQSEIKETPKETSKETRSNSGVTMVNSNNSSIASTALNSDDESGVGEKTRGSKRTHDSVYGMETLTSLNSLNSLNSLSSLKSLNLLRSLNSLNTLSSLNTLDATLLELQQCAGPGLSQQSQNKIKRKKAHKGGVACVKECSVTGEKRTFGCTLCDKSFFRSEHLRRHLNSVHLQLKKYRCQVCVAEGVADKYFSRSDNYKAHLKTHGSESGKTVKKRRVSKTHSVSGV